VDEIALQSRRLDRVDDVDAGLPEALRRVAAESREREAEAQVRMVLPRHLHSLHECVDRRLTLARFDVEVDAGQARRVVALDERLEARVRAAGERARRTARRQEVRLPHADEALHVRSGDRARLQSAPVLAAALTG